MSETLIVIFSLNNELCGVETSQVQEIVKYQTASKVPDMPLYIEGIINLRGKTVVLVDLNRRFGLGETAFLDKTKIIVSRVRDLDIGFIVNDVSEIVRFAEDEIDTAPEIIRRTGNEHLMSVGKKGDRVISILDLNKIMKEEEIEKIRNVKQES